MEFSGVLYGSFSENLGLGGGFGHFGASKGFCAHSHSKQLEPVFGTTISRPLGFLGLPPWFLITPMRTLQGTPMETSVKTNVKTSKTAVLFQELNVPQ